MKIHLFVAALLYSVPALAEIYTAQDDFHFSLSRRAVTAATDGDLHISAIGVFAEYGTRRVGREGGFQTREVLVLDEPYEVKDASGALWQMRIWVSRNRTIEIDLPYNMQPLMKWGLGPAMVMGITCWTLVTLLIRLNDPPSPSTSDI